MSSTRCGECNRSVPVLATGMCASCDARARTIEAIAVESQVLVGWVNIAHGKHARGSIATAAVHSSKEHAEAAHAAIMKLNPGFEVETVRVEMRHPKAQTIQLPPIATGEEPA